MWERESVVRNEERRGKNGARNEVKEKKGTGKGGDEKEKQTRREKTETVGG